MAKKFREQQMERANRKHRVMLARGLATPKGAAPKKFTESGPPILEPIRISFNPFSLFERFARNFGWKHTEPPVPQKIEPKGEYKGR